MTLGIASIVAFVIAIGILVAVHEFGHYWVARRLGFKVLRFSIGFGRPLWSRRGGPDQTEYVIAAIPLGGYVKLLDEREGPVPRGDEERAFGRRPPLHRIAVLVAGPLANFLFAIVACWIVFMHGVPGLKPVVGAVTLGSPAAHAGLAADDRIVAVAGEAVATREAVVIATLESLLDTGTVPLLVARPDGGERHVELRVPEERRRDLTEPGELLRGLGFSFWLPAMPVVVGTVEEGGPAARAGLAVGDRVVAIDGAPIADFTEFLQAVRGRPAETLRLGVVRGEQRVELTVTARTDLDNGQRIGRIGITPGGEVRFPDDMLTEQRFGPIAALAPALRETWDKSALTLRFLWRMVTGDVSVKNISGPINIAQHAGITALEGFAYFVNFLAVVSISLGVLNLLPIPILDGGQILYQCAELLKGRPLSEELQMFGQKLGIALLVALMGIAFYNDLSRLFG
jgi:regulator of sigma E protease